MSKIHESYYQMAAALQIPLPRSVQHSYLTLCVLVSKVIFFLSVSALAISFIPRSAVSETRIVESVPAKFDPRIEVIGEAVGYLLENAYASPKTVASPIEQSKTCRIAVPKAALRSGPGKSYSALMAVAEGTVLVIDGEQDGWLRVLSPTGSLAWVSKEVVKS